MEPNLKKLLEFVVSKEESDMVSRAYDFAERAHRDQKRHSGEPYFNHLFLTALKIAELGMDATTISAGLLHDVIEDTKMTTETIEAEFGKDVRFIVEGVSRLGELRYHGSDRHNESLRKLLLATSKDIRVLIVKLCDRLHNMQTLEFVPKEKQFRIARETIEIYAPIAYRLGIRKLSRELEDLAFKYVEPLGYKEITELIKKDYDSRVKNLEKFRKSVSKELASANFVEFHSDYRVKGSWSLYKKYLKSKKDIDKITDVLAMRIITKKTEDCYRALGIVHASWKPVPGKIKDYIAFPKQNGYQSLHTTVFTGNGDMVEIQIRTEEMHTSAEYGVASHGVYKGATQKQLAPWLEAMAEFSEKDIKTDFLSERIFVFTPKGDVVDLPQGASVIDFAYSIHSAIGNKMSGAKVNGQMKSIDTILKGGEIVEVVTNKNSKPNRKWLEYAKTSFAKKYIRGNL